MKEVTMLKEVSRIVREAGQLSLERFGNLQRADVEFKGEVDLVTEVDRAVEAHLRDHLAASFPESGFIGEEGTDSHSGRSSWFVADPLDGTTNYVHGHPFYAVSLGFREQGVTTLGVVYAPALDLFYHALRGGGAWCNGKRLQVSNRSKLLECLATTGFACVRQRKKPDNLELFREMVYRVRDVRRCGSAAIDLCFVAEGRYDLFWEINLAPWDIAAGVLLVEEAGGRVTDLKGGPDFEDQRRLIASNGRVHAAFLDVARSCGF